VLDSDVVEEKTPFELLSNLIIVPVKVNDLDLNFILDTGATKTIIFSLKGMDPLHIKEGRYIQVNRYGNNN
jgi:hypothetical protein